MISRYKKYKKRVSKYDYYVDRLIEENKIILRRFDKIPYVRSDGEEAIARALVKLKYRYVSQWVIAHLNGDEQAYRIADFYLPKQEIMIEHPGMIDHPGEKARYEKKRQMYITNNIKYIFIYPFELNNLTNRLKKKIDFVIEKGRGWDPSLDGNSGKNGLKLIKRY